MTMRASIAAEHGTLRDRRGYPSDEVNLCAYPVVRRAGRSNGRQAPDVGRLHLDQAVSGAPRRA
jgi:hypothetical protein